MSDSLPLQAHARGIRGRQDDASNYHHLDEATASIDEKGEADLYRAIAKALPRTTLVSIGHRSSLNAFHKRRIAFTPHDGAPATVASVA